ncbi:MAG TPA: phospholipase D family protein [Candidatus Polarisedimenticolia bacterium]|nr:phospholipase D family protein [Candidatus Polarisedimenticolia bacterium]
MLYNQPLAVRFGNELIRHVDPFWDKIDIAVAWVRASGMAYLTEPLANFLRQGGEASFIVGIDLRNTTREGLEALLALEQYGRSETFVYHNEAGSIFHPKLYLFRNEEEARLIVGSNNLTEYGLYVNVEAGLQVDMGVDEPVVAQTLDALSSWKDTAGRLAARLDQEFLARLRREGYVPDEAVVRAQIQRERERGPGREGPPLFGSRRFGAPARAAVEAGRAVAARERARRPARPAAEITVPSGTVLLMRLRKAHVTDRPTQTQIPFRVVDTFFKGAAEVRSRHSGQGHAIIEASARGGRNTMKMEIPEMREFTQPVARFERTPEGIMYETYDMGSPQGNQIMASLEEGRGNGTTQMTISDAERATWWRFI